MRVALDIDGVLANILQEIRRMWGTPRVPSAYSIEEMYPHIPVYEIQDWVHSPVSYRHLIPVPGAQAGVAALMNKHDVILVTSRPVFTTRETEAWLARNKFPPTLRVVYTTAHYKDLIASLEGVHMFVEDRLDTANRLAEVCTCYLFDWPYNKGPSRAIRVSGWEELIGIITREEHGEHATEVRL